jgi:hypothetical protein
LKMLATPSPPNRLPRSRSSPGLAGMKSLPLCSREDLFAPAATAASAPQCLHHNDISFCLFSSSPFVHLASLLSCYSVPFQ